MSCEIVPRVSSALALTEFHSLSPPWVHSAETPGPLMLHPGALLAGNCIQDGFNCGSFCGVAVMPRMFSASYQRYSCVTEAADWSATVSVAILLMCKRDACAPVTRATLKIKTGN